MQTVPISGPDDLREATRGADLDIVQLKPGRLRGSIKHIAVGSLEIGTGLFSAESRVRGTLHPHRIVLGTLLASGGRSTQWWREIKPGDVGIFPAQTEIDVIHRGVTSYLLVSIPAPDLLSMLAHEDHLADPSLWNMKGVYGTFPAISTAMLQHLIGIISSIEQLPIAPSTYAMNFLERSIVECFLMGLASALPSADPPPHTGARLVSEVEDYVDAAAGRPLHVSELCSALKVTRRTLHRAFAETLGMGPTAYLRSRRLSAIRSALRRHERTDVSIGDLAFEFGFPEPGRFAAYYRNQFGETPSETLRSRQARTRRFH